MRDQGVELARDGGILRSVALSLRAKIGPSASGNCVPLAAGIRSSRDRRLDLDEASVQLERVR